MPLPTDSRVPREPTLKTRALTHVVTGWLAALLVGCAAVTPPPAPAPSPAPLPTPAPVPEPPPPPPAPPPQPPPVPPAPDPADAAARRLLAFSERLRDISAADLTREQARLEQARASPAPEGPAATLELALLLVQTRHNGDVPRALALLEPLTRPGSPAPWAAPARLLHARLLEQRRLEEQVERQGQQVREQQRRIEQLTSQLEALKAIERSLNTRPAPPPASAPAQIRNPP